MSSNTANFDGLKCWALDEADRMLDMDSGRACGASSRRCRRTVDAAPLRDDVEEVTRSASQIMRNPKMIRVGREQGLATTIEHVGRLVPALEKADWLSGFLKRTHGTHLVFVRTKRGADKLARRLSAGGIKCAALHADRTQSERSAAVEGFRAGRFSALIATDIAAAASTSTASGTSSITSSIQRRRIRAPCRPHGPAEAAGTALTLVAPEELRALRIIEKSLNVTFTVD
jgi:ATP-dependent RNA helicase RhlE